jgi:hypothetical protein
MFQLLADLSLLEWVGYIASGIIALSMTMNSIVKFRLINLVGAGLFSTYGFIIGAYPVGILNAFIFSVDIYYLVGIFGRKENFEILEIRADNHYLLRFLDFHNKEIQKFFPGFTYKPELNTISFFVLRNMAVAGLFLGRRTEEGILHVGLDYVVPEYRDFKNGKFVYYHLKKRFKDKGITKVVAPASGRKHAGYLMKLGFARNPEGVFEKLLND